MTGQVHLKDAIEWEAVEVGEGVLPEVGAADEDIVDVEQKPAPSPTRHLAEEVGLGPVALLERKVCRRVLEEEPQAERVLNLADMVDNECERTPRIGERQEVVEKAPVVARPARCSEKAIGS